MRTGELYQRYYGLYIGRVVSTHDPDGLGRIRVETDQFQDSSDDVVWASVARPFAGDGMSVFFTPKVDDQVVLGYLVGDVHEPIVLGYAHSTKRPRPGEVDQNKHGVVTKVGSVVFDEDARKITVTFNGSTPLTDSSITMDDTGVTIEGGVQIMLKATSITLQADAAVNVVAASLNVGALPNFGPPGLKPTDLAPGSPATMDFTTSGLNIKGGATATIDAASVCVNGHGVVLSNFVTEVFLPHVHIAPPAAAGPVAGPPPVLGVHYTVCGP